MAGPMDEDFAAYVRGSGPRLKRLAFLLTGDLDSAEDLLQSAYAKVLPHWGRVSTYDSPDAYMRRVMVSLRTSWWRRHRGREVLSSAPLDTGAPRPSPLGWTGGTGAGPDFAADQAQLDLVLHALRLLPARQQVAVVLRHYCDLSEAEAAAVMGISVGGVKSQASKGLAALRAVLAESPTSEEWTR